MLNSGISEAFEVEGPRKVVRQGRQHLKDHRPGEVSHTVSIPGDGGEEQEAGHSAGQEGPRRPNTPAKAACRDAKSSGQIKPQRENTKPGAFETQHRISLHPRPHRN